MQCIYKGLLVIRDHNGPTCLLAFLLLLPSENIKIKIYRTIICLLFCMGVNVGLTLREEYRLMVFENRVLKKIVI